ncbi:MAG TPA: hypothetical protein VGX68_07505 [Thermoanaerobaculia bacterium]|jgi:hypothetical protein|nr:hypothetical protein [Thermoanaerobaculia bacterium]
MRVHSTKLWLFVLALALLLPLSLSAQPPHIIVPQGTDCWHTDASKQDFRLPPGFFFTGSKLIKTTIALTGVPLPVSVVTGAFPPNCGCPTGAVTTTITWTDQHGNPVSPNSIHKVSPVVNQTTTVDTCVRRTVNADFPGQGASAQVSIRLVRLSLKSVNPLTVQFPTGPKRFDVFVKESATQPAGSMILTAGKIQGKKASGKAKLRSLPITYDVEFREVLPSGSTDRPIVKRLTGQRLSFTGTNGTFTFDGVRLK